MSLDRRLKRLEGRSIADCPCQHRRIEMIDLTEPDASPVRAAEDAEEGRWPTCGPEPPVSIIQVEPSEWDRP
jgi:hypothetical protein